MTVESDLRLNEEARAIAKTGMAWFQAHPTVESLRKAEPEIQVIDQPEECPAHLFLVPLLGAETPIGFGYIIKREGVQRHEMAAVAPLPIPGGTVFAICAVSDHISDYDAPLATHVIETNIVHEATHALDFVRTGHLPGPWKEQHLQDMASSYYSTPHEYNAFFQQGLFEFLNDIDLVKARIEQLKKLNALDYNRFLSHLLFSGAYWNYHFCLLLNRKYRRKLLRRFFRFMAEHPLPGAHVRKRRLPVAC